MQATGFLVGGLTRSTNPETCRDVGATLEPDPEARIEGAPLTVKVYRSYDELTKTCEHGVGITATVFDETNEDGSWVTRVFYCGRRGCDREVVRGTQE